MFFSPIATQELRKTSNELLDGNIFSDKKMQLPMEMYKSLL
jgi:hypothetical protein